ncbi:MAG: PQQ-binding-like beta-propeller repeat protein [Treponema sp.]|nr:PQQ-binding-like beta-propeller repeat protein [Treponema sp.]
MKFFEKKCVLFFIFYSLFFVPAFSQSNDNIREQGLITSDPFWRQALGGEVLSLPHVQAQSAVVALDGGNIKAYSTAGTPMWNYSARGRISPFITRSREGTSYLSRTNGIFIAVNRAGRELWRRDLESPISARVVIGWDGRLFIPTEKQIFCYTASGNRLWSRTFESNLTAANLNQSSVFSIAPKLDRSGGILFAIGNDVYRIDQFGNTTMWKSSYEISDKRCSFIFLTNLQQILAIFSDGSMEILGVGEDWYLGAQSENHVSLLPMLPARPIAADTDKENNIAAVLNDGRLIFLSIDEKKILWTGNSHIREMINNGGRPDMEAEVLFDARGIYVLSRNGATSFSHEGRRFWFSYLQNAAAIPAFGDDGVLYSGGRDWILYAYKMEDRVLPQRNALYGPLPDGTYGLGRPGIDNNIYPLNEYEKKSQLEIIRTAVNSGQIGSNEPVWTSFLLRMCAGQEPIQSRITALNLLGKIGSYETIQWLINVYRNSNEPLISSAAINAIGSIGVDPEGVSLQAFSFSISQDHVKNEHVLTAIASATGALCRFSGPPLSEMGVRILNMLSAVNQQPSVRRQAARELASLR